jgi:hypothetical protein
MTTVGDGDTEPRSGVPVGGETASDGDVDPVVEASLATPPTNVVVGPTPQEYVFNPGDVAGAAAFVNNAAGEAPSIAELQINGLITEYAKADSSLSAALIRELGCTFLYRLSIDRGGDQPAPGATLEPKDASQSSFLRPIGDAPPDVSNLWEALIGVVTHPRPLARLHDLLFTARRGDIGEHGRLAIAHYLDAAPTAIEHDRVEVLLRSWTIARAMKRDADENTARAAMWVLVEDHADRDDGGAPGVTLPLLNALLVAPRDPAVTASEPDLDPLLEDLAAKYQNDFLVDRIALCQRRRANGDQTKLDAIDRRRVQARLDHAASSADGHVRMHFLERAAALARDLGVDDLADTAVTAMQNISPDELKWVHFSASAAVPVQVYESYLRVFDFIPDWRAGLGEWLATGAPSGAYSGNVRAARERGKVSVLRHIFGSTTVGAHGLPQQSSGTSEALERDIRQGEESLARNQGRVLAMALDRIRALGPDVTDDQITDWLVATYGSDPALAYRFARSLVLFWDGRYDEAAHTVASIVEAGARSLLREVDEPLYRVEKGKSVGQFPGLGAMLPKLHSRGLTKDWQRYLEVVLLPEGLNLRNIMAHGLAAQIGRVDALLILRAAALFVVISPSDGIRRDETEVESVLRNAPPSSRRSLRRRLEAAVRAAAWELRRRP